MTNDVQKLLDDCIGGQSFGWENFVDKFLPHITRVAEFSISENGLDSADSDLKQQVVTEIFQSLADDEFRLLKEFDRKAELATYLSVIAQRQANEYLATRTTD